MIWLVAILCIAAGFVAGWFFSRSNGDGAGKASVEKALEATQFELEQYKQEVSDHFAATAELLEQANENYRKLCGQLNDSAHALLDEKSRAELPELEALTAPAKALPAEGDDEKQQPRDYSGAPSGLISGANKEKQKETAD
ncbi:YhcB family protein [Corallincola platygyrae]|uniref:Z-ring associated protein G n=1 Tax=Corallincola platygyrae TaxID=1193278 RepID=A0ABW4XQD1_9GAMM